MPWMGIKAIAGSSQLLLPLLLLPVASDSHETWTSTSTSTLSLSNARQSLRMIYEKWQSAPQSLLQRQLTTREGGAPKDKQLTFDGCVTRAFKCMRRTSIGQATGRHWWRGGTVAACRRRRLIVIDNRLITFMSLFDSVVIATFN